MDTRPETLRRAGWDQVEMQVDKGTRPVPRFTDPETGNVYPLDEAWNIYTQRQAAAVAAAAEEVDEAPDAFDDDGAGGGSGAGAGAGPVVAKCALDAIELYRRPGVVIPRHVFSNSIVFFAVFHFADGKGHDKTWIVADADASFAAVMEDFRRNRASLPGFVQQRVDELLLDDANLTAAKEILAQCTSETPTRRLLGSLLGKTHSELGTQFFPPMITFWGLPAVAEGGPSDYQRFDLTLDERGNIDPAVGTEIRTWLQKMAKGNRNILVAIDQLTGSHEALFRAAQAHQPGTTDVPSVIYNARTSGTVSDPGPTVPERIAVDQFGGRVLSERSDTRITLYWPFGIPMAWKTTMSLENDASGYYTRKNLWLPGNNTTEADIRIALVGKGVEIGVVRALDKGWADLSRKLARTADGGAATIEVDGYLFSLTKRGDERILRYPASGGGAGAGAGAGAGGRPLLEIVWNRNIEDRYGGIHPMQILLKLLKANGDSGTTQGVSSLADGVQYDNQVYSRVRGGGLVPVVGERPVGAPAVYRVNVSGDIMSLQSARACGGGMFGLSPGVYVTVGAPQARFGTVERNPDRLNDAIAAVLGAAPRPPLVSVAAARAPAEIRRRGTGLYTPINSLASTLDHFRLIRKRAKEAGLNALHLYLIDRSARGGGRPRIDVVREDFQPTLRGILSTATVLRDGATPDIVRILDRAVVAVLGYDSILAQLQTELVVPGGTLRDDPFSRTINPTDLVRTARDASREGSKRRRVLGEILTAMDGAAAEPLIVFVRDLKLLAKSTIFPVGEVDPFPRAVLTDAGNAFVDGVAASPGIPELPGVIGSALGTVVVPADVRDAMVKSRLVNAFWFAAAGELRYRCSDLFANDPLYTTPEAFGDTDERWALAIQTYANRTAFLSSLVDVHAVDKYAAAVRALATRPGDFPSDHTLITRLFSFFRSNPFYYDDATSQALAHQFAGSILAYQRRTTLFPRLNERGEMVPEDEAAAAGGLLSPPELGSRNKLTALEDYYGALGMRVNDDGAPPAPLPADAQGLHDALVDGLQEGGWLDPRQTYPAIGDERVILAHFQRSAFERGVALLFNSDSSGERMEAESRGGAGVGGEENDELDIETADIRDAEAAGEAEKWRAAALATASFGPGLGSLDVEFSAPREVQPATPERSTGAGAAAYTPGGAGGSPEGGRGAALFSPGRRGLRPEDLPKEIRARQDEIRAERAPAAAEGEGGAGGMVVAPAMGRYSPPFATGGPGAVAAPRSPPSPVSEADDGGAAGGMEGVEEGADPRALRARALQAELDSARVDPPVTDAASQGEILRQRGDSEAAYNAVRASAAPLLAALDPSLRVAAPAPATGDCLYWSIFWLRFGRAPTAEELDTQRRDLALEFRNRFVRGEYTAAAVPPDYIVRIRFSADPLSPSRLRGRGTPAGDFGDGVVLALAAMVYNRTIIVHNYNAATNTLGAIPAAVPPAPEGTWNLFRPDANNLAPHYDPVIPGGGGGAGAGAEEEKVTGIRKKIRLGGRRRTYRKRRSTHRRHTYKRRHI